MERMYIHSYNIRTAEVESRMYLVEMLVIAYKLSSYCKFQDRIFNNGTERVHS